MSLSRSSRRWSALSPVLAGVIVILLDLLPVGPLGPLRRVGFDAWQRLDPLPARDDQVVIVDIDEESLATLGRWPWSRAALARLLDALAGARVVGLDVLLREPERTAPQADTALAAAMARVKTVLAVGVGPRAVPTADRAPEPPPVITVVREHGTDPTPFLPRAGVAYPPLPAFATAAAGLGVSSVDTPDVIVRGLPGVVLAEGSLWPGFVLEMLRVANDTDVIDITADRGGVTRFATGALTLSTDRAGTLLPRFAYLRRVPVIPASRLLAGGVDRSLYLGRVAIVGVGAAGEGRTLATPLGQAASGISVEAAVVASALDGQLLWRPMQLVWFERLGALFLSGLVAALLAGGVSAGGGGLLMVMLLLVPGLAALAFLGPGLLIDWVIPDTAMLATCAACLVRLARAAAAARREQAAALVLARLAAEASAREQALRQQTEAARESLSLALEAAQLGAWDADLLAGTWRHAPRYGPTMGLDPIPETWSAATMVAAVVPEDRPTAAAALSGETGDWFDFECRVGAVPHPIREIRVVGRIWRNADGVPTRIAGIVADITRERALEQRVRQAERMQAIGMLAGGVAHSFNNLLTIVLGQIELAQSRAAETLQVGDFLRVAAQAAERGADVAQHLLRFARGQRVVARAIDVALGLQGVVTLLRGSLPASIRLFVDLAPDLGSVEVDPGELDLALLNLVLNARDALSSGGTVRMAARREILHRAASGLDGTFVVITVADDGPGIEPAVRDHVFEPFVTTKPPGIGTGLGLSQVHGFAHQAGGTVEIESSPESGTIVTLYLPAWSEARREPVRALPRVTEPDETRGNAVLLVDDDELLASTSAEILTAEGCDVRVAHRGAEALAMLRAGPRVDLLLTDVVMPGELSGTDLAAIARREFPDMLILLTTGYSQEIVGSDFEMIPVILKPYRRGELCRMVASLLGSGARVSSAP